MARGMKAAAEKYERQKELARERQRRRRAKLTEEQLEKKRKYDRDRKERLKLEGKLKTVSDMSEREHRRMKKYWREQNRKRSLKKKALANATADTPPASPSPSAFISSQESSQKKRGRKIVRRDRAKAYRTIKKQEEKIKELERKVEKYKKRLEREHKKSKPAGSPSPNKLVRELVGKSKVKDGVRKQLFLGFVLQKQLKKQKEAVSGTKKKQIVSKVLGNKIIKKYRVQKHFNHLVPYKINKILSDSRNFEPTVRKRKSILMCLRQELITFFENDCVSRILPGKKDVVQRGGIKKQRRVLLEPLHVLHEQFQNQFNCKISLSSFCRGRPFWVTLPKQSDRETCACIKHSNMSLLISALKLAKVISENSAREVLSATVCSKDSEECLMSRCQKCRYKTITFNLEENFKVKYFQWKKIKERRVIKNKTMFVQKMIKEKKTENVRKVMAEFLDMLPVFKKHVFFMKHQAKALEGKIKSLEEGELAFRIDFSENYVCKYATEIQSVHFGASKRQLSLNTGVVYFKKDKEVTSDCFASVSDNLDHQAHAVWGHMKPILQEYSKRFPKTTKIHFFSDGPSNQYRNRFNMKLFQTIVPEHFKKIEKMTWNFTEAGHGKGPMDGVGGTLKRQADWKVLYGTDITCAKEFVDSLKGTNVHVLEIPPQDIENMKAVVASMKIPAVKGIMQVHQVTYSLGVMYARSLSCFKCPPSQYCDHFTLFEVFPDNNSSDDSDDEIFPAAKGRRMKVYEIYSDSEEDTHLGKSPISEGSVESRNEEPPLNYMLDHAKICNGSYVIVRYLNESNKKETRDFVGVCLSDLVNGEIEIMFLKESSTDKSLFVVNESDVATVPVEQIVSLLPPPNIIMKGNREFYKLKMPKH